MQKIVATSTMSLALGIHIPSEKVLGPCYESTNHLLRGYVEGLSGGCPKYEQRVSWDCRSTMKSASPSNPLALFRLALALL